MEENIADSPVKKIKFKKNAIYHKRKVKQKYIICKCIFPMYILFMDYYFFFH